MPKKNPPTGDPILDTLRAARVRQGLSQQEVGQMIGRQTYQSIQAWENATNSPSLDNLRAWAASLGYSVELVDRSVTPC